jgi:hypothetical protein
LVAVLAVVLTPPSLRAGLLVDYYHHELLMSGSDSVVRLLESPLDMLQFFDGDPNRLTEFVDYGFLPWWTYEGIKGAFWRLFKFDVPLKDASLHRLQYRDGSYVSFSPPGVNGRSDE